MDQCNEADGNNCVEEEPAAENLSGLMLLALFVMVKCLLSLE